jgi:DUF971 family protein
MALAPKNMQLIGSELAIVWLDGHETYLPLEALRRACPCAVCAGEPDVTGKIIHPRVTITEKSFLLRTWKMIGGYALQLTWEDGHNSGLYPFAYLQTLAPG